MSSSHLPLIPLSEPWFPPGCAEAVKRQVESTFVGPGAASTEFGARVATESEVFGAVPVSSGTVALSISAQALGLAPGDEVVVPAYGVISVINGFASAGFRPRLAEIDPNTGCIDPERLQDAVTPRTKAVCFVDFCGSIGPEIDTVASRCRDLGLYLIEDAAWALGRGTHERKGGGIGDIATTSFSVPKLVTTGQGGAVLVKSVEALNAVIGLVDQGGVNWRKTNINDGIGSNLRLSDLASALGLAQLNEIGSRLDRKRRTFSTLAAILGTRLFQASDGDFATQHIVFLDDPDKAVTALRSQGIMATRQYRGYYEHPPFRHLGDRKFPASAFWSKHAVYLPFGVALTELDAERIGFATLALQQRFLDHTR